MKKYIIINSSPRVGGNSDNITKLAVKEFEQRGDEVAVFNVRDHETKNCIACDTCKTTDVCIHKDDTTELIQKAVTCDGILFVSPIYFGTIPGTLKIVIDRLYVLFNPAKGMAEPSPERKCGIVLTYGSMPDSEVIKAAGIISLSSGVIGLGESKTVLCGQENAKDAFANNKEYQDNVKTLIDWM